jgi:hypothetical protein
MARCLASVELQLVKLFFLFCDILHLINNHCHHFSFIEYESAAQKAASMVAAMCDVCSNYFTQDANYV